MGLQTIIEKRLREQFEPLHLEVHNESSMHSVPPGSETHFRVVVVSKVFSGLTRVERSRLVTQLFEREFKSGLHAFSQKTFTPEEWEPLKATFSMTSPDCLGGSKASGEGT